MRVLAIDTATPDLVTGLVTVESGAVVASVDRVVADTRAHNEQLMPTIEALCAESGVGYADLDAVVVGVGPGPFTGLRVGMATAQALGHALGLPVYGVCSLDAINQAVQGIRPGRALVATDARRKEIYWAAYDGLNRTNGPAVVRPEELDLSALPGAPEAVSVPEQLAARLPDALGGLGQLRLAPRPAGLVAAVLADTSLSSAGTFPADPAPLVPLYLRRPDAKEPAPKPRSAAIPEVEL